MLGAILFDMRSQRLTAERPGGWPGMDSLTGLGNRLAFDETLGVEIARARARGLGRSASASPTSTT